MDWPNSQLDTDEIKNYEVEDVSAESIRSR